VKAADALPAGQRAPSAAQLRSFALLSVLYAVITAAVLSWADEPGPAEQNVVVVYGIGIAIADFCTAVLLGGIYLASGRRVLLLLACVYLYGGLMAAAHIALFPGALFPEPLFGGRQTVTWLFAAWLAGTAALYLATVLVAARGQEPDRERRGVRLFAASALTLSAVVVLCSLAARWLGSGMAPGELEARVEVIQWAAFALCAAAYALILRRRAFGDLLYLWLGLVLLTLMATLALANLAGGVFGAGWYASRANLVVCSCLLLAYLLGDLVQEDRRRSRTSAVAAYGGAVAVTLAAIFLRWFLDPWLGYQVPYLTLYGAVAISVWFGGLGPAVLSMVLGYAVVNIKYVAPVGTLSINTPDDGISLALFALSAALVVVLGEAMRRARDRYRASEIEVKRRALQLQRADRKKSEFLAVLSHELRNPLAPLRTGLALLDMQRGDLAGTAETRAMMERQVSQLARLIDDLLDVSRIDRGKLEMRQERLALEGVLKTAIDTARPNMAAKGHALRVTWPKAPLYVDGDPVRIAQVVSNLLNNAAKFTPAGGSIELTAGEVAGEALICVADNGIGIDPGQLEEVFDMFVQLDASHAAAGGLGLGLTLARSIVERHGGRIEARSGGPGQGAEFIVRLPLAAAPAAAAEAPAEAKAPSRRRVLVVDDNVDAAQTLAQYLRMDGHRVESAVDGEGALRIAEVLHPEVAFIDLNMPTMDGTEVARRLRRTPWGREAALIALTGMGQQADISRTREAGFDEHITKPADLQLVSRLAAAAHHAHA
jgi:signal transduction histidine kinase/CheY-like chemotaxis protein